MERHLHHPSGGKWVQEGDETGFSKPSPGEELLPLIKLQQTPWTGPNISSANTGHKEGGILVWSLEPDHLATPPTSTHSQDYQKRHNVPHLMLAPFRKCLDLLLPVLQAKLSQQAGNMCHTQILWAI